ncbi:uncharacterized protein LOC132545217 [Ylistrum balloti]|uniref:uncharacterized protein LOC132545217 n=1 Tax=Ylistrum balloti TaxID=509963 RepID=UPI002905C088|nr:uncharacterized protein LOC132545217 [Ylistrum balloti]
MGSHQECQPNWSLCETEKIGQMERYEFEPSLSCTALYKDKLSRCFHLASPIQDVSFGAKLPIPLVTGIFLSPSFESGQTKPVLSIDISLPTDNNNAAVMQLLLRSTREVSDEYYVDPYYEKFPTWRQFPVHSPKIARREKSTFRSTFGNLDTCNVRCTWGKCEVFLNLYLLTITIFTSSRHQNLQGQSITYQVTSHNRRYLPDTQENEWKPNIMTAVLPEHRGIHVVFEPLPFRFVTNNTYYKISLQDWETWEVKLSTTVKHNKAGDDNHCIFDFDEPDGVYEVMIEYMNCNSCPFKTWVKSADFTLPEYSSPQPSLIPRIAIPSDHRIEVGVVLGLPVTVILLSVVVVFCYRIFKARQLRNRNLQEENLFTNNNLEMTSTQHSDQDTQLNLLAEKLETFCYPDGCIDDVK